MDKMNDVTEMGYLYSWYHAKYFAPLVIVSGYCVNTSLPPLYIWQLCASAEIRF